MNAFVFFRVGIHLRSELVYIYFFALCIIREMMPRKSRALNSAGINVPYNFFFFPQLLLILRVYYIRYAFHDLGYDYFLLEATAAFVM